MNAEDVLETLDITSWTGPFDADTQLRAANALEDGRVLFLPRLPFEIRPDEQEFLTGGSGDDSRKNISLDPATGRCHGTSYQGDQLARLAAMIDRFGQGAEALLRGLVPGYAPHLQRARTSFRPAEIRGRDYSERHDDRLMHVDAFPTRPLRGRRILRVFSNVAPGGEAREWRVGEPFPDFARAFMPRLSAQLPGKAWAMNLVGLTKAPRSEYDHYMLGLHDAGKHDRAWQANSPQARVDFPSGTSWACYTDSVLHAALAGRFALEQTFHLPVEAMTWPERTPLRILEGIAGRPLI